MNRDRTASAADTTAQLRSVYRAHLPRIYGYLLYRLGGRRSVAEELTQEVFLAYVAAVRRGDQIDDPQGWLITVARNHYVGHLRKAERTPAAWMAPVETDDLAWSDAERAAMEMLEQLPPPQRAAMALRYIDDLPVAEVAELLGRSLAATESLLARARRTLKELER